VEYLSDTCELRIYPNPTDKYSLIEISCSITKNAILKISDISGRELYSSVFIGFEVFKKDNLPKGLYFVTVFSDQTILTTGKLIVY
jgi:hypothetical protein